MVHVDSPRDRAVKCGNTAADELSVPWHGETIVAIEIGGSTQRHSRINCRERVGQHLSKRLGKDTRRCEGAAQNDEQLENGEIRFHICINAA
jgi:hypothetical protein